MHAVRNSLLRREQEVGRGLSATGETIASIGLAEAAGGGEDGETLAERGGTDAAARTQPGALLGCDSGVKGRSPRERVAEGEPLRPLSQPS
jgi:hypothetical protein